MGQRASPSRASTGPAGRAHACCLWREEPGHRLCPEVSFPHRPGEGAAHSQASPGRTFRRGPQLSDMWLWESSGASSLSQDTPFC